MSGPNKSLSDQSVGFILRVEASAALTDLKKAENTYARLDRQVTKAAKSLNVNTNSIVADVEKQVRAFEKLAEAKALSEDGAVSAASRRSNSRAKRSNNNPSEAMRRSEREHSKHRKKVEKSLDDLNKHAKPSVTPSVAARKASSGLSKTKMSSWQEYIAKSRPAEMAAANAYSPIASRDMEKPEHFATELADALRKEQFKPQPPPTIPLTPPKSTTPDEKKIVNPAPQQPLAAKDNFRVPPDPNKKFDVHDAMWARDLLAGPMYAKNDPDSKKLFKQLDSIAKSMQATLDPNFKPTGISFKEDDLFAGIQKFIDSQPNPAGAGKGKGVPSASGFDADTGKKIPLKDFKELFSLLPDELANKANKALNIYKIATNQADKQTERFLGVTLSPGNIAKIGLLSTAISLATAEAGEFQDTMMRVRKITTATADQAERMADITLNVARMTGQATDEVASVVASLRSKGGFEAVAGSFENIASTAVMMSEIMDVNANEMAEFLAETSIGMNLGVENADKFAASLINIGRQGGISFDQLKDTILATKDVLRRFSFEQKQNMRITLSVASAAQQFSKNYGDAADAANMLASATNRGTDDYMKLLRLVQMSGEAIHGNLEDLATQNPEKFFELAAKGAKNFMDTNGRAWAAFPEQIERVVGSVSRVQALSRMTAQDLAKTIAAANKSGGKNQIKEEFREMMQTVNSLKERIVTMFETFMVYVGKPLLAPIVFALDKILAIIQMIPAPVLKLAGYLLGIKMTLMAIQQMRGVWSVLSGAGASKSLNGLAAALDLSALKGKKFGEIAKLAKGRLLGVGTAAVTSGKGIFSWVRSLLPAKAVAQEMYVATGALNGELFGTFTATTKLGRGLGLIKGLLAGTGATIAGVTAAVVAVAAAFTTLGAWLLTKDDWSARPQELAKAWGDVKTALDEGGGAWKKFFSGDFKGAATMAESFADNFEKALDALPAKVEAFLDDIPWVINEFTEKGFAAFEGLLSRFGENTPFALRFGKAMIKAAWVFIKFMVTQLPVLLAKAIGIGVWSALLGIGKGLVRWQQYQAELLVKTLEKIPILGKLMKWASGAKGDETAASKFADMNKEVRNKMFGFATPASSEADLTDRTRMIKGLPYEVDKVAPSPTGNIEPVPMVPRTGAPSGHQFVPATGSLPSEVVVKSGGDDPQMDEQTRVLYSIDQRLAANRPQRNTNPWQPNQLPDQGTTFADARIHGG